MDVICPKCQSHRIDTRNRARKVGGIVGAIAGATNGAAGLLEGVRAGWIAVSIIAPQSTPHTKIAGAVIGGIVGAATGCAIGISLGELVDDNVLLNYCCLTCGYNFGPNRIKQPVSGIQRFGQNEMADFNHQE